jgi:hypothetical protein
MEFVLTVSDSGKVGATPVLGGVISGVDVFTLGMVVGAIVSAPVGFVGVREGSGTIDWLN